MLLSTQMNLHRNLHTHTEILSWSSYHTRNSFCYKSPRQISTLVIWYVEVERNLFHRSILPSERWRPLSLFWLSSVFNKARYVAALCREAREENKDVFWRNDAKFGFMKVKSLSLHFLTIDVDLRKAKVAFWRRKISSSKNISCKESKKVPHVPIQYTLQTG